jgi:type II secretory pathway pseudopilin PulG
VRRRRQRDERGASLVLAIAFLVVIGALTAATLSSISTGLQDRVVLDKARNREYAADAAIEQAIATERTLAPGLSDCTSAFPQVTTNNISIRVNCKNAWVPTFRGFLQRDVVFIACEVVGTTNCGAASTPVIIRAQVYFEGTQTGPVTGTYIQSWSVNG